jgi:MHS family proline/betaine transporter-like MFS transporter
MAIFKSLNREQKEAIGLLQIGTFLEYFDLMLYVHMAVLLNELFFPKTDTHTAALLSAFAFCSTWFFRPFGALLFGWIGDNFGRKPTVVITTTMMAVSCIIMANLPTYAQVGITAAYGVTLCRTMQSLSSMGEICGANIYLTEITKPPYRYPIVASTSIASSLGPVVALFFATLVMALNINWRVAFWIGATIAFVGSIARYRLRETPDFLKKVKFKRSDDPKLLRKNLLFYFLTQSGWPVFFYFTYMYCGDFLKNRFHFTSEQVIQQNLKVSFFQLASFILSAILCSRIHPLTILKIKSFIIAFFVLVIPFWLNRVTSGTEVLVIQIISIFFALTNVPATAIFIEHLPINRRFTYDSFTYALSRAVMYIVTSFGLVYLTEAFGHYGFWVITIPVIISFLLGVLHFERLEQKLGRFPKSEDHQASFKKATIFSR